MSSEMGGGFQKMSCIFYHEAHEGLEDTAFSI